MEEGTSNLEGGSAEQEERQAQLAQDSCNLSERFPMVGESTTKIEDEASKADDGSSKLEACSLNMDIVSPNKMEEGSPKTDISLKMEVLSPKMDATSNMEISSPNMEASSPNMEVSSPNMEEGSAKMEEVAVKMGEVSVKSEERCANSKENTGTEQGSTKMEEVAVKMGEVSVKAEGISNVTLEKGSVKMEEVSVKMGKVSVQSDQSSTKGPEVTFRAEETSETKVQVYRGTTCVTEGEVPDWLTVDILVRAIRNDKPGTKKPQIRPFGTPVAKTRTASHGHPSVKTQTLPRDQMTTPFNTHLANRPSGNDLSGEPSSSHLVPRSSNSQSSTGRAISQSPGKPSTSQPAGKPSTSQYSNKSTSNQSANKSSGGCLASGVSSESKAGQTKGKSSGGRIKGKSSLSLHKGKASAGEASTRSSGSSPEDKDVNSAEDQPSGSKSEGTFGESECSKTVDDTSRPVITENCSGNPVHGSERHASGISARLSSNESNENKISDDIVGKTLDDGSDSKMTGVGAEDSFSICVTESNVSNCNSKNKVLSHKGEASAMFKKPVDPPKRTIKKSNAPPKGLVKKQTDPSKETFKKPTDPPKRTMKKSSDLSKSVNKTLDPPKVRFKKPEVPSKNDAIRNSTESIKGMFKDPGDSSKGTSKKPTAPPKRSLKRISTVPKKPKEPPLQVIRFISQRLSSGNTVYRVRATAVRGCVARDCHLVVKHCSNTAEVIYYKKIAPRIPYVPRVLLCDKNIVVMDDLVHEGFRRPRGKFTPAQMTVAIDGLARLHTASVVALKRDPSLMDAFHQAAKATETDIARDLRLLADRVKLWSLPDADYYAARCRALAECVPYLMERLEPADTNMTVLLHGNVSPRNVFFLYDSRNPRLPAMASFVDFANVYWGHPAMDISLVTGRAGGFWEGYKIVLLSLLTRASGRMWMPQPEIKDCGETYAFALLRAVCSSVSGPAAKVLEAKLQELFPVFRQYSWLDFW